MVRPLPSRILGAKVSGYDTNGLKLSWGATLSGNFYLYAGGVTDGAVSGLLDEDCYEWIPFKCKPTKLFVATSSGDTDSTFGVYVNGSQVTTFTLSYSGQGYEVIDLSGDGLTFASDSRVAIKHESGTNTGKTRIQVHVTD